MYGFHNDTFWDDLLTDTVWVQHPDDLGPLVDPIDAGTIFTGTINISTGPILDGPTLMGIVGVPVLVVIGVTPTNFNGGLKSDEMSSNRPCGSIVSR